MVRNKDKAKTTSLQPFFPGSTSLLHSEFFHIFCTKQSLGTEIKSCGKSIAVPLLPSQTFPLLQHAVPPRGYSPSRTFSKWVSPTCCSSSRIVPAWVFSTECNPSAVDYSSMGIPQATDPDRSLLQHVLSTG